MKACTNFSVIDWVRRWRIFPMFLMCREAALQTALICLLRVRQLSSVTPRLFTPRLFTFSAFTFHQFAMVSENVWTKIQPCMCKGPLSSPHFVLVCFLPSIYLCHECKLRVAAWMFPHLWAKTKCTIVCRLHTCDNLVRVSWWFHLNQLYTVWKARVQEQTLAELRIAVWNNLMFHLRPHLLVPVF